MLILNSSAVEKAVSYEEAMDYIEEAYRVYERKAVFMPPRIHVDHGQKTLLYMPCFVQDLFGTKILTVFPENTKKGLPAIDGVMLLNDLETGKPIALIDGKSLTAMRTGAVGGVAVRHTAPKAASSLGIVGAGTQGYYQAVFACQARPVRKVLVFDMHRQKLPAFVAALEKQLENVEIGEAASVEQLLMESQIIVTATTSNQPVLPDDACLLRGRHFVGIGSYKPSMREYPDALFGLVDTVYVDTMHAKEETGDLVYPLSKGLLRQEQVKSFGHMLLQNSGQVQKDGNTTFVKSVGMAIFDLVVSQLIYKNALAKGLGQEVSI